MYTGIVHTTMYNKYCSTQHTAVHTQQIYWTIHSAHHSTHTHTHTILHVHYTTCIVHYNTKHIHTPHTTLHTHNTTHTHYTIHTHTILYTHTLYYTHIHTHTFNGLRCIPDSSQLAYLWGHAYVMFHQEDQSMTWLNTVWLAILSCTKGKESPLWSWISGHLLQNFTHHPYVIFCTFIPFFTTVVSVPCLQLSSFLVYHSLIY